MPQETINDGIFTSGLRPVTSLQHAKVRTEPIKWPNDARVAVTWTVIFELYSEVAPDPTWGYGIEDAKKALYGGRRGVWRLLDQFDRHQMKASFLINGYAAEKFPEAVVEIKKRGHEIVPYGYSSPRRLETMKLEQEKADIVKTLDILHKLTGAKPTGWVSPDQFPSNNTLDLLAAEGMTWNGDFPNDDLPYVVQAGGKSMVIIPFSRECDDYEIYGKNLEPPQVFADYFSDSLDVLYKEGATFPKMMNACIRCQYFGRPVGTKALDNALHYGKSLPHVWFATRSEIADWWVKQNYS
jgi:peptidoglycan/xylan/chitin deacetylase (PgdA/CDA1 family)